MAITKARKEALVQQYKKLAENSSGIILASFSGVTVKDLQELRGQIREVGGEFHIVKNSLMDLAFKELGLPLPEGATDGTTAIGFAMVEVSGVAKAIVDLSREQGTLQIKGGLIEGELIDQARIIQLADLPPMPVVRAQFLGLITAPAGQVVGTLAATLRQLVGVMHAYSKSEGAEAA
ncbi:MAG: 50S ribosomal protein L10 [Anaerolineales bacterium]